MRPLPEYEDPPEKLSITCPHCKRLEGVLELQHDDYTRGDTEADHMGLSRLRRYRCTACGKSCQFTVPVKRGEPAEA
jgi:DNA-directed RNA polymerase subunit RPC12/RpoP